MAFFDFLKAKKEINPEDHGWSKLFDDHYKKNSYTLYRGHSGWVLDKSPKDAPGIICRFGKTLTSVDIEEANSFAEHIPNPTRRLYRSG